MKSMKWMVPLVASVLVISGCSQMQQSASGSGATAGGQQTYGQQAADPATTGNRLATGSAVGVNTGGAVTAARSTSSFGGATGSFGDGRGNLVGGIGGSSTSTIGRDGVGDGFGSAGGSGLSGTDNRLGGPGNYKVTDLNDPASILSRRVIYFAYDQSTIEPEYFEILDAHSELLASNPNLTIRLEGHADERGSREYNVALSERRAQSVKQFMDLKGVGSEQSQTVAYGEELPLDPGHDEAAWSKNRRVEIKYIGR